MTNKKTVHLYTDGSCSGNPGPGGWGYVLIYNSHRKEVFGHALETTNNRMEMQAVIEGLNQLKHPCHVMLFTDSKYVMQGATEWLQGWKAKNWKKADKKPVNNKDLWEKLDLAMDRHTIEWEWVKGHAGHPENECADQLAVEGTEQAKKELAKAKVSAEK